MREEEIFQAAVDLSTEARASFLLTACEGQDALRGRVERLLASHDNVRFMRRVADRPVSVERTAELARSIPEGSGEWIGKYKLLQQIGEGGCGLVYMAQQDQPVRRTVALKIIKLGMDTRSVIARFEQERQALAMMDHPNIAKVFDAGASNAGRPFFVMELVRGIKITDYCDQNQLATTERLALFRQVCHAIQHAHQKGIIHRDMKPSNILVTLHDGVPVPKVIDFGIAKATTGQRLADATVFTAFEQFIGTPAYMSPEQAEMSGLDIDTRSDIYSLGVLLYELLTGRTPFDARQLMASGIAAMRKTIRETEPVRPSTRLTQELVVAQPGSRASSEGLAIPTETEVNADSRRRLRLREQINRLRGDLDWIVMKCLEKDRSRRYETANDLAADLQRHLNNEPILARPPSAAYKFQKTWRRNRLALTAAGAVAIALLIGIGVSTWQAFKANRARIAEINQRLEAQTERNKAEKALLRADAERVAAEHHLYVANLNLAGRAWEQGDFRQLQSLLEQTRSYQERGFEWSFWQRQAHLNLQTLRGHVGLVRSVAFSPDGQSIATASWDQTCRVWNAATGREQFRLIGHDGAVQAVAFSPDGRRIVTGSDDHTARVWEVAGRRELFALKGHDAAVTCVSFSSDGQWIVTGSGDGTARLWEASTGRQLRRFDGHTNWVNSVSISRDGRRIVTASADRTARVWDPDSGREVRILPGGNVNVLSVAFSPDGERIVTGHLDRTARVWEAASGRKLPMTLVGSGPISSVAFSSDGKLIATGSWDSTVQIWDSTNSTKLITMLGHLRGVFSVAFSPDGKQLVTGGDESAKVWEVSADRESLALRGLKPGSLTLAISPDGQRIATGGTFQVDGGSIDSGAESAEIWDSVNGNKLTTLSGHTLEISSAAFSPDGLWIVTGSADQTARVWKTANGQESLRLTGHKGAVNSVAFSPDGRWILTGGQDHTAKLWDATGQIRFELIGHTNSVTSAGFSRDGTRIVTGSLDGTAKVWDAASQREVGSPLKSPPLRQILSVAFSPDGECVAAGGYGGLAVVWKVASGVELCQLMGDNTPVSSVAFSPDGRRVVTGSYGGIARVWEALTGRELLTLGFHGRAGSTVAFSNDGLRIVTGSIDLPARVWQAAAPEQITAWDQEESAAAAARPAWQRELSVQLRKHHDQQTRP